MFLKDNHLFQLLGGIVFLPPVDPHPIQLQLRKEKQNHLSIAIQSSWFGIGTEDNVVIEYLRLYYNFKINLFQTTARFSSVLIPIVFERVLFHNRLSLNS